MASDSATVSHVAFGTETAISTHAMALRWRSWQASLCCCRSPTQETVHVVRSNSGIGQAEKIVVHKELHATGSGIGGAPPLPVPPLAGVPPAPPRAGAPPRPTAPPRPGLPPGPGAPPKPGAPLSGRAPPNPGAPPFVGLPPKDALPPLLAAPLPPELGTSPSSKSPAERAPQAQSSPTNRSATRMRGGSLAYVLTQHHGSALSATNSADRELIQLRRPAESRLNSVESTGSTRCGAAFLQAPCKLHELGRKL